jgi:hypothetical protein
MSVEISNLIVTCFIQLTSVNGGNKTLVNINHLAEAGNNYIITTKSPVRMEVKETLGEIEKKINECKVVRVVK